ncbi:hypothetical protein F4782DRAFT_532640 [Xylaria castorea]|nr:hypothetical protein F4782DRAFT_532640 [Xylaria castorea]
MATTFRKMAAFTMLSRAVSQESPPFYNQSREDIGFSIFKTYDADCWNDVPSVSRKLLFYAIEVVSKLDCSLPEKRSFQDAILTHDFLEIRWTQMPRAIPTEDEISYAIREFEKTRRMNNRTRIRKMCAFTAVAVAIMFLHGIPLSTRKYKRKVVIYEDCVSIAYLECHAKGLILFCVENPFLHIGGASTCGVRFHTP